MTIDQLVTRLKDFKKDKARLEITKLKISKMDISDEQHSLLVSELEYKVHEIDIILKSLVEKDYLLIKYKFLEGYTESQLIDKLLISERTLYRKTNEILSYMLELLNISLCIGA